MNSFNNIGSTIGSAAAIAVAVGLTAGSAPASAAPQQSPGIHLSNVTVDPTNSANHILKIEGTFPMSEGDAHDRVNNLGPGGGMDFIVFADDPGENDAMIGSPHGYIGVPGPAGGWMTASPFGIRFLREISVPTSMLNEDDGMDEIYVRVRFVQGTGAGDLRANTGSYSWNF